MAKRGRKSKDELTTLAPVAIVARPEPALDLTPEQADVWRSVTDALPADWFAPENYPLLAQYCRHTVDARRLAQLIDQECARKECDVSAYGELLKLQRAETAALKTLAASMRLAQQARYQARGADRAKNKLGTVARPWET